ncbi:MAG: demethoxyubiquinone hydroxylase family protein [Syntrophomonas sp.]
MNIISSHEQNYSERVKEWWFMALLGDPFVANVPKQLSGPELVQAIRVDIAGEMEAIIGYEAHAMATSDERVKKVLYHIANEERRHVGELQQLLYVLNPGEEEFIQKGIQNIQQQQAQNFQPALQ